MKNKLKFTGAAIALLFALTGCSNGVTNGFHKYFVENFANLIHFTAGSFAGSYGVAIILITLAIRLILSPLMLKQIKNQRLMKVKMDKVKPEMTAIQAKIKKEKDPARQRELQQEMMALYRKHGINPMQMGCLPILIQMPILMGFYYAIRSSHEIASHNFLWFSLGQPDIILTLIAGAIYYMQFRVAQANMPQAQTTGAMKYMGLISPLMIMFISFNAPAALPLYWSAGGLFLIGQTLLANRMYKNIGPAENSGKPVTAE